MKLLRLRVSCSVFCCVSPRLGRAPTARWKWSTGAVRALRMGETWTSHPQVSLRCRDACGLGMDYTCTYIHSSVLIITI